MRIYKLCAIICGKLEPNKEIELIRKMNSNFGEEVIRQKKIVEEGARKAALQAKKEIIEIADVRGSVDGG